MPKDDIIKEMKKKDPNSVVRESELSNKDKAKIIARIRRKKKDPNSVVREGE